MIELIGRAIVPEFPHSYTSRLPPSHAPSPALSPKYSLFSVSSNALQKPPQIQAPSKFDISRSWAAQHSQNASRKYKHRTQTHPVNLLRTWGHSAFSLSSMPSTITESGSQVIRPRQHSGIIIRRFVRSILVLRRRRPARLQHPLCTQLSFSKNITLPGSVCPFTAHLGHFKLDAADALSVSNCQIRRKRRVPHYGGTSIPVLMS